MFLEEESAPNISSRMYIIGFSEWHWMELHMLLLMGKIAQGNFLLKYKKKK